MQYRTVDLAGHPEYRRSFQHFHLKSWPEYLLHSEVADRYYGHLYTDFPTYQIILLDEQETVVGCAQSIPLRWDGTKDGLPSGWDAVLEQGCLDHQARRQPNTLSALAAMVLPERKGEGLSRMLLEALKSAGATHGLTSLIAPVRPMWKSRYPLTPIDRYAHWQRPDGAPFDPWMRVHWRMGAKILKVAPESQVITGTVAEWEEWTGMSFPESGHYLPPGAPVPLDMDVEQDQGRLAEPNIWMVHPVALT